MSGLLEQNSKAAFFDSPSTPLSWRILLVFSTMTIFSAVVVRGQEARRANSARAGEIATQRLDPEPIRISIEDLPEPFATESAQNHPQVIAVPDEPILRAPEGFNCNLFAEDVPSARWLAVTPEGDVLCASGRTNRIYLLQDSNGDGVAESKHVFLDEQRGANLPFGMDFAKVGEQWYFYLGNTDAVLRYPYRVGQTQLDGNHEQIASLPGQGYNQHWTRNVRVSPDQHHLFVTVGSESNVDREEPPRASVLRMRLDGSQSTVFASGLRNPVGLDFHPETGAVYVNVNERDGLGDDLVPDYLTQIDEGDFFGWPYAYFKPENLDPRRMDGDRSERPDLVEKTQAPDVLYRSHSAALGLAFTRGEMFPEEYRRGAFAAFRGSWNRDRGTGYKIVFVPFESDRPAGYYQDFVTGFLTDPAVPATWGRPVDVLFAPDGSLLFTEEAHGRIYRVSYR